MKLVPNVDAYNLIVAFRSIFNGKISHTKQILFPAQPFEVYPSGSALKIACVGDSLTFGYCSNQPSTESYPSKLQELLPTAKVANFGRTGATLTPGTHPRHGVEMCYTKLPLFTESIDFGADLVIIMLGTNDCSVDFAPLDENLFKAHYKSLIGEYGREKCVILIPPLSLTEEYVVEQAIPLIKQVAKEAEVGVVDLYAALGGKYELFDEDKVHFNASGYAHIASIIAAEISNRF